MHVNWPEAGEGAQPATADRRARNLGACTAQSDLILFTDGIVSVPDGGFDDQRLQMNGDGVKEGTEPAKRVDARLVQQSLKRNTSGWPQKASILSTLIRSVPADIFLKNGGFDPLSRSFGGRSGIFFPPGAQRYRLVFARCVCGSHQMKSKRVHRVIWNRLLKGYPALVTGKNLFRFAYFAIQRWQSVLGWVSFCVVGCCQFIWALYSAGDVRVTALPFLAVWRKDRGWHGRRQC